MTEFPTGREIIDENRHGLIGKPVNRVDGWAKVTGGATYAYETTEEGAAAYGFMVTASIAKGRIAVIDTAAAEAAPGVQLVLTHLNAMAQPEYNHGASPVARLSGAKTYLADDQVRFFGDPVALVVADTFENARAAAALVRVTYEAAEAVLGFEAHMPDAVQSSNPTAVSRAGDFEAAFAAAPVQIDQGYTTPAHIHSAMEPHASLAVWKGDELTVHTSAQILKSAQGGIANTLGLDPKNVRVVSRYIGGGFGGKLHVDATMVLAAMAAKALGRPVKVALSRPQVFAVSSHRPQTRQRIRLGADRDGRLTAIGHEGWMECANYHDFTEPVTIGTRSLYAAENRMCIHNLVKTDTPMADAVRAPGEASGMLALEIAMDELAEAVGVDPVELRIRNDTVIDPDNGKAFGSRSLELCLREGSEKFGWSRRVAQPGEVRDGRWLVGIGMAAAIRANYLVPSKCGLSITMDGTATVRQAMTDIGTGTYTILAQIAAEALGLPVDAIRVEIGDSRFAPAAGSGGSFGAASAGGALLDAAMIARRELVELAVADPASPLHGAAPEEAVFTEGTILIGNRSEKLTDLLARSKPEGIETVGAIMPNKEYGDYSQHAHGAHFAEVGVDLVTGEVRLRRMLGVFAAGRILNEKTARSQCLGGMIWGVGSALMEENHYDARYGSFAAQDLASYHVPAHADIVDLDAIFVSEEDDKGNPMKIKGVGELGICGAGAAVANAVYNACGVRIRHYPLTLDKVLAGLG